MRLDEKARENLEAAERLLPDSDGDSSDAWPNAAASRAYYAAYLAVAHAAQDLGIGFTSSEKDYYRHDSLPGDARLWGILDDEGRSRLRLLNSRRIKADYWEDQVDLFEANEALELAAGLVHNLLSTRGTA